MSKEDLQGDERESREQSFSLPYMAVDGHCFTLTSKAQAGWDFKCPDFPTKANSVSLEGQMIIRMIRKFLLILLK